MRRFIHKNNLQLSFIPGKIKLQADELYRTTVLQYISTLVWYRLSNIDNLIGKFYVYKDTFAKWMLISKCELNEKHIIKEMKVLLKLKMHSCVYIYFVFHHFSENNLWKAYTLPNIKQQPCMALDSLIIYIPDYSHLSEIIFFKLPKIE